jgi:2-dehydro-3-deoxyphosphogluconate aldolase/(4S)-4-hydroxy-2-oxoglutarate aldolase
MGEMVRPELSGPLGEIAATGCIAVVRAETADAALGIARILHEAGMRVLEVAFTVPDAERVIGTLAHADTGALVGAGTVLTAAQARAAVRAGSRFLFAPNFSPAVAEVASQSAVPYIPGVLTPGEVATALAYGFRVLKLFPARMAGIDGMRALAEPFPTARFVPTGGVAAKDVGAWLAAGAVAVGMGSYLTRAADPAARAREVLASVRAARAGAAETA